MPLDLRGVCPLLAVFDMPRAIAFYRDILGFEVVASAPSNPKGHPDGFGWAWLRHGTSEVMLNTLHDPDDPRPPQPDASRVDAHADTIIYLGAPEVDAVYRHLQAAGVAAEPPTNAPYGMRQLYTRDPDGFGICFQWPVAG
ncbi:MAG: VOC family protein [Gemmatimonadales bacterium]